MPYSLITPCRKTRRVHVRWAVQPPPPFRRGNRSSRRRPPARQYHRRRGRPSRSSNPTNASRAALKIKAAAAAYCSSGRTLQKHNAPVSVPRERALREGRRVSFFSRLPRRASAGADADAGGMGIGDSCW